MKLIRLTAAAALAALASSAVFAESMPPAPTPKGTHLGNVIVNPYGFSPLTAVINRNTKHPTDIRVTVKGKPEGGVDITYDVGRSTLLSNDGIPVFGLYPDYRNTVVVSYKLDGRAITDTYSIVTPALTMPYMDNRNITALPQPKVTKLDTAFRDRLYLVNSGTRLRSELDHAQDAADEQERRQSLGRLARLQDDPAQLRRRHAGRVPLVARTAGHLRRHQLRHRRPRLRHGLLPDEVGHLHLRAGPALDRDESRGPHRRQASAAAGIHRPEPRLMGNAQRQHPPSRRQVPLPSSRRPDRAKRARLHHRSRPLGQRDRRMGPQHHPRPDARRAHQEPRPRRRLHERRP